MKGYKNKRNNNSLLERNVKSEQREDVSICNAPSAVPSFNLQKKISDSNIPPISSSTDSKITSELAESYVEFKRTMHVAGGRAT